MAKESSYERLTFLDNSFLLMEGPNSPMHVGGVARYEIGSARTQHGGVDIDRLRAYVESRLHLIPRYRQRLAWIPVEGQPVWVDDDHFNIHYHVRHTALPRPGDDRQLKRLAARILSQHLDRSKPLWEIWIVEGLEGDEHFAMLTKIHHCMVDGMSSVDLMTVLLSPEPMTDFEPAPGWSPRPAPASWELLADSLSRYARLPLDLGREVPRLFDELQDPRSDARARLRAVRDSVGTTLRRVSDTPLNQSIGPHRRFDWTRMELDRIKRTKNRLGGSLNDIVLTTVSGAIRRFLERRRLHVESIDFRVMAPVSVRSESEKGTLGNRVSAWMIPLPLDERDPQAALRRIRATTSELKETKQAMGAEVLTGVMEWTPSTLLSLASGMLTRALPFNTVVTNVPGPQVPLYMLDSKMIDTFGLVPLVDHMCLGNVLFSYAGYLHWGFTAEWDLIPDLHDYVLDVEASFAELESVAEPIEVRATERADGKASLGGEGRQSTG